MKTATYCINNYKVKADPRTEEIKEQEQIDRINRAMSLTGQGIIALVLSLGLLTICFQVGRWFNFF
jgi:hypothetical protein